MTACLSCQQVKDARKLRFPLQSIDSFEINEVVQIDHQKICMIDSVRDAIRRQQELNDLCRRNS